MDLPLFFSPYISLMFHSAQQVESVLGADVCLEDVSFSNGTVIAKFCVGFVEAVGASPTIFVHNLTSAIQSGSVGNLTVNSTSFEVVGNCTAGKKIYVFCAFF